VEDRDHREGQRDRDDRQKAGVRCDREPDGTGAGEQKDRNGGLTERTQDQARQRDAELTRRQVSIQMEKHVLHGGSGP